jgi:hypothetical protein
MFGFIEKMAAYRRMRVGNESDVAYKVIEQRITDDGTITSVLAQGPHVIFGRDVDIMFGSIAGIEIEESGHI